MRKIYRGERIDVTFDLARCVHIAECLRGLPEVFDLDQRPWILPDAADVLLVAEVVERCPSGALLYHRRDGRASETHVGTTVTPIENGPLLVVGEIRVRSADGTEEVLPRAMLCRCGASNRKPFCDNRHFEAGFQAPGVPYPIHRSRVRPSLSEPIRTEADPRADR